MAHEGAARRRAVTIAGHTGDAETALQALADPDPSVRAAGLGALERLERLANNHLVAALEDPDIMVRRRAAEIAAMHPDIDLLGALNDPDPRVVEVAAWSCGEHESNRDEVVERLLALAADSDEPLVRESAVAALGAIGDERAVDAIIAACADKPAVRRRAVLALAPFIDDDPENEVGQRVDATIERALEDRDWQVRQAAEDLRRIIAAD